MSSQHKDRADAPKKRKYEVYFISKMSKYVGTFEAENEDTAMEMAADGDLYQSIGGACWQCTDNLGDADDGEFVAYEEPTDV